MKKAVFLLSFLLISCGLKGPEEIEKIEIVFTQFTHLPVELDKLCEISRESGGIPITPYHAYFYYTTHIEGTRKWYFNFNSPSDYPSKWGLVKVYLPAKGVIRKEDIIVFGKTVTLNGEEVLLDTRMDVNAGSGIEMHFFHLALRKAIKDEVDSKGSVLFEAGTHIGYIYYPPWHTLDFGVSDINSNAGLTPDADYWWNIRVNPLDYFSPELRNYILEKYSPFYEKMKQDGTYPFSDLTDSRHNVNIYGTIWGVWFRDDIEEDIFRYDPNTEAWTIVTLLDTSMFHRETFWKVLDEEPKISGVMLEEKEGWNPAQAVKLYDAEPIGISKFYIISGDDKEGIAKIVDYYGDSSRAIYLKYRFIENTESRFDDKLLMKGFFTEDEARNADLSKDAVVFRRVPYK